MMGHSKHKPLTPNPAGLPVAPQWKEGDALPASTYFDHTRRDDVAEGVPEHHNAKPKAAIVGASAEPYPPQPSHSPWREDQTELRFTGGNQEKLKASTAMPDCLPEGLAAMTDAELDREDARCHRQLTKMEVWSPEMDEVQAKQNAVRAEKDRRRQRL